MDTAPAGWTLLRRTQNSDTVHAVYWRTANASEPAQYSWTLGTTTGAAIALQAFSGADPTAPIDIEAGQTTPAAYLHSTPGITTTASNTMLVTSFAGKSTGPWAPPPGMTEISEQSTTEQNAASQNMGISLETSYQTQSSSGVVGAKTADATNIFPPHVGHTHILALRPASQTPRIYFIHTDHLNTPRLITSDTGQAVWSWANDDPYGNNAPNENPSGAGNFTCNLRLPGQYFDAELNTHYNYFRDYDPSTGRYVQSDPIGIRGGINTYEYAYANPIQMKDPFGLAPPQFWDTCRSNPVRCMWVLFCGGGSWTFAGSGQNNTEDALRHCTWSCCMARGIGPQMANTFGNANEDYSLNPPCEKEMDLANNAIGRSAANNISIGCTEACRQRNLVNNPAEACRTCR